MHRRSLLRASDMTVFIGVDGAVQHGLSIMGILLILVLFTSCFLLMFVMFAFFSPSVITRCPPPPSPRLSCPPGWGSAAPGICSGRPAVTAAGQEWACRVWL